MCTKCVGASPSPQCARLQQLARELESRNAALEVELRRAEAHAVAIGHELDDALAQVRKRGAETRGVDGRVMDVSYMRTLHERHGTP